MKQILILGAGSHGRTAAEVAAACGYSAAFLDDAPGEDVIGRLADFERFIGRFDTFFVGIGNNSMREDLQIRLEKAGIEIATLIHPAAYVSPSASIAPGTVVAPGAIVNTHSRIARGCILSAGAIVDHDAVVEDFAHINAGSICKGGARIEHGRKLEAGEVVHGFN